MKTRLLKFIRFKNGEVTFLEIPNNADATKQLDYIEYILGQGWNWHGVKRTTWVRVQLFFHNRRIDSKIYKLKCDIDTLCEEFYDKEYRFCRIETLKIEAVIDKLREQLID